MIRTAQLESANNGPSRSSLGLDSGKWAAMVRKALSQHVQSIERFVAQRPGVSLGVALSLGMGLGWWVKRQ